MMPTWLNSPALGMTVGVLALLGALALGIKMFMDWVYRPELTVGVAAPLPPSPKADNKPMEPIKPKVVIVYKDRPVYLPAAAPTERVTATGHLFADERPYTLAATLDTETGKSRVWAEPEPQPWLSINPHTSLGAHYGLRDGQQIGRLSFSHEVIQAKAARLGVMTTIDTDGRWFAGVGAMARW